MNMEFNIEQARTNMIQQQIRTWDVLDEAVLDAISNIPRERYVPQHLQKMAFVDTELPLGRGQVMMAPKLEARMLQALAIQNTEQVLEIGTGSGYTAACMARLGMHVETVDIFDEFTANAKQTLSDNGIDNVTLSTGDASKGWNPGKRYDVIAVTGSIPEYDACFENSLEIGGRLFIVVGKAPVMEAMLILRTGETEFVRTKILETLIPALVNANGEPKFIF